MSRDQGELRDLLPDDQPIAARIKARADEVLAQYGRTLGGPLAIQGALVRETVIGLVELERRVIELERAAGDSPGAAA